MKTHLVLCKRPMVERLLTFLDALQRPFDEIRSIERFPNANNLQKKE